jgi:hypothetical protein
MSRITSAFAQGYGGTGGLRRCCAALFHPRITRIDAKIRKKGYLSARRTSTTITLFTAPSSQYVIA